MTDSLEGKVALITGGGRGLGRAISIHLAAAGCTHICINYRSNEASAQETAALITAAHPSAHVHLFRADVAEPEQVHSMIADIVRTVGAVSVLVNNAGVSSIREINEVTLEDFDLMIRTNCRSAFVCTQAVIGAMQKQRWGRIINLTSIAAYTGGLTGPHYAASKAGMIGLTNAYAHRLVKFGITSNAVSPGLCDSDMLSEMGRAIGGMDKVIANTKPGRLGTADEVAVVVAMLARNGYVNGQTIGVDGGIHPK